MTTRGLRPDTQEKLQHLIGADPEVVAAFLVRRAARREQVVHIVQQDETENADFYRELGDR
jgi:hypothetical protein